MFSEDSFFRRHKILTTLLVLLLVVIVTPFLWLQARARGPHHNYELDFMVPEPGAAAEPGVLQVGVAKREITPIMDQYDPWVDVNDNNKFDPDVDTYTDRNGNGKFDGVWLAGFGTNRPAKGVHDPLWARAIAFRNNGVTMVMVTIDSIGIYHNEFVTVRKMLDPALDIDHVVFSSTHCHEVPDTMKIWSFAFRFKGMDIPIFGFDQAYMDFVNFNMKEAIEAAVRDLEPADMYCAQVGLDPEGFVRDTRKPVVMDNHIYLMRFTKPGSEETIATVVNWGNHPETLGSKNPMVTSDFCHYLREGVENGVPDPNGVPGMGGMCLYFQGMVGGLMTQLGVTVPDRNGKVKYKENSFQKAEALGYNTAIVVCKALRSDAVWKNQRPRVAVAAKTFKAPMEGTFKWAIRLGLIHEGYYSGGMSKTEANVARIGDVLMLTTPGEIYPEIVEGGVLAKSGRDFEVAPVESPPLRDAMEKHARMAFVIGLANDEIGYILPKTQWDAEEPYIYGDDQYGEENSGGPDVGPAVYDVSRDLLERMNAAWEDGAAVARAE